ncbi:hypothetical protein KAU33_10445 [Candidatus Dependentiae bacterium]|nr:hypothetical protein [Candidatus Dependentiae bacterium]
MNTKKILTGMYGIDGMKIKKRKSFSFNIYIFIHNIRWVYKFFWSGLTSLTPTAIYKTTVLCYLLSALDTEAISMQGK